MAGSTFGLASQFTSPPSLPGGGVYGSAGLGANPYQSPFYAQQQLLPQILQTLQLVPQQLQQLQQLAYVQQQQLHQLQQLVQVIPAQLFQIHQLIQYVPQQIQQLQQPFAQMAPTLPVGSPWGTSQPFGAQSGHVM